MSQGATARTQRRSWPLRAYMGLVLAVFLAVAVAAGFYSTAQADDAASSYAAQAAQRAAQATAQEIRTQLNADELQLAAAAASSTIAVDLTHPSSCTLMYSRIGPTDRGHLDLLSSSGQVLCSSTVQTGRHYGSAAWFATASVRLTSEGSFVDPIAGPSVAFGAPARSGDVLAEFVSMAPIATAVEGLYGGAQDLEFLITNRQTTRVISRSIHPQHWVGRTLGKTPFGRSDASTSRPDVEGRGRIYGEATVPGLGWHVYVGQDQAVALAGANDAGTREFALIAFGLAVALAATFMVYRRITGSIHRLDRDVALATTAEGDLLTVSEGGPSEVARLGGGVNALIEAVRRELTERQQAEAAYRSLFEANPLPMWVFDLETFAFLEVNAAAIVHYGYTRDEFLAMRRRDIWADSEPAGLRQAIMGGQPLDYSGPWRHRKKDGSVIDVMVTSRSITFGGRPARFDVGEDITERDRVRNRIAQSQRLESLGKLAGGVAHDFNNLLGVIQISGHLTAEWVSQRANSSREDQTVLADLEQIEIAAAKGSALTSQLLAFARKERTEPRPIQIAALIDELEQLLKRAMGEHIELTTQVVPGAPLVVADPTQLEQVLINLALNARDAMVLGGQLVIEVDSVEVDDAYAASRPEVEEGTFVRFTVSDTGTGMPPEVAERAFEPFFTTKAPGAGSGLGLATAYGVVSGMSGHISIYSEVGVGTTVTVLIPAAQGATAESTSKEVLDGVSLHFEDNRTILVVEDEPALLVLAIRLLARNGYQVLSAASGTEAISVARNHPGKIDLLLTDVVMPHMMGNEVARRIGEDRPSVRVVYMSGYPIPSLASDATSAVRLINKPFSEAELLHSLEEAIRA